MLFGYADKFEPNLNIDVDIEYYSAVKRVSQTCFRCPGSINNATAIGNLPNILKILTTDAVVIGDTAYLSYCGLTDGDKVINNKLIELINLNGERNIHLIPYPVQVRTEGYVRANQPYTLKLELVPGAYPVGYMFYLQERMEQPPSTQNAYDYGFTFDGLSYYTPPDDAVMNVQFHWGTDKQVTYNRVDASGQGDQMVHQFWINHKDLACGCIDNLGKKEWMKRYFNINHQCQATTANVILGNWTSISETMATCTFEIKSSVPIKQDLYGSFVALSWAYMQRDSATSAYHVIGAPDVVAARPLKRGANFTAGIEGHIAQSKGLLDKYRRLA